MPRPLSQSHASQSSCSRARFTHPRLGNPNDGVFKRDGLGDHVSAYLSMDGSVGEAFMILIPKPYVETDDFQGASFFGYMGIAAALVFCSKFLKKWVKFLTERLVEELANN